jgi:peptide/nickel transport system permease protein
MRVLTRELSMSELREVTPLDAGPAAAVGASETAQDIASAARNPIGVGGLRNLFRQRGRGTGLVVIGSLMLVVLIAIAAFGALISPHDPSAVSVSSLAAPSAQHWLGTDAIGRDVFSRLIAGGRSTIWITFAAVAIAFVVGVVLGLVAGYLGGIVDQAVMRILDVLFAFPGFLLAVAVVAALGPSIRNLILTIGIVYTPHFARVTRAPVLSVKRWDHVEAARSIGVSGPLIVVRHILPSVVSPLLVQTSLTLAQAIVTITGLSFLGLGPPPPDPNWGSMLSDARQYMEIAPFTAIGPAVAIVFATLTFIILANGLRDLLDVQGRA